MEIDIEKRQDGLNYVPTNTSEALQGRRIVRTIIHALRHDPLMYGLDMDQEGWVDVRDLVIALQFDRPEWENVEWRHVESAIQANDPYRFDIRDGSIRAAYGHSIHVASPYLRAEPPDTLFHATTPEAVSRILKTGLEPMQRQFVHLTEDLEYASRVASSRQSDTILLVHARGAHLAGIRFYRGNYHVWLALRVPPEFLGAG
jgi:putative RNA 2'-phosphotransferase